ncbi:MAG: hypothetical protein JW807_01925 [Spirochaetes bacterium]|nr:hypothetical protein [Spirochaetota bacterium]
MNKSISSITVILAVAMLIAAAPLYSLQKQGDEDAAAGGDERTWSVSVGFGASCYWWTPVWGSFKGGWVRAYEYDIDPNFIYGPLVMVQFNPNWGLSGSFTYGTFRAKTTQIANPVQLLLPSFLQILRTPALLKISKDVIKMDADLLLNYRVNSYARIFFGPKYQGYSYIEEAFISRAELRYDAISFGAGVNFTVRIIGNFYFNPAVSIIGLYGFERISGTKIRSFTADQSTGKASAVGGNGTAMFSYYIPAAWMTLAFGYRAQCIYYFIKQNKIYDNNYDLFHGPYVAAIVTF